MISTSIDLSDGETIVLGKVTVTSPAAPQDWSQKGSIWKPPPDQFNIILLRDGENTPIRHQLTDDGSFYWSLVPGRYHVIEWEWRRFKERHTLNGHIGATFEVGPDDLALYVGELVIMFHGRQYAVGIHDQAETAVPVYRVRYPHLTEPRVAMMTTEELPEDHPGGVSDICGSEWGVTCNKTFRGIRPTLPEQDRDQFPMVASNAPRLAWTASNRDNASYDVLVREAIRYGDPGVRRWIEGRVVHYAAGLSEPGFSPPQPLASGRKYFWSVRVRDDDRISTWSTMNYREFGFFLVAAVWRSGSGIPFRFETP